MRNRLPLNAIAITGREKKPAGIDFDIPVKKKEKKVKEEVQPELFEQVYNDAHYDEYKKTKNKNLFEEVIEKMMLESCYDESFQPYIEEIREIIAKKMPVHKKRFAILCTLDKNRNLMRKAKIYQDGNISMMEHIKDYVQILRKYVRVSEVEKKKFGEVMTPIELVTEMLNKLPREVWSNPNLKWLDPCNGVGPFGALVVAGLMKGLAKWEPDEEKRYKHILENMVYVCELQPKNMFLWLSLMDPQDRYEMNVYCGSFIDKGFDKHMKEVWNIDNFDIVIGNPPYQEKKQGFDKSQAIWHFFVNKSISFLSEGGYLCMVHPSGWRSVDGVFKETQLKLKNNLLYLEMHDEKDGEKTFNATTSYDWYCYSNKPVSVTKIKDQDNNIVEINLNNWEFIPNGEFELFSKLISSNEKVEILHSFSAYETRKNWISKEQKEDYIYPCVYTITKDNTINLYYSSTNQNGHFDVPKVIWTNGMASQPTIDYDGTYGLTQFAYAIVDDVSNLEKIKKAMDSDKFINLMKLCYMSSGNRFDKKVLSLFKKDFWKHFIK